MTRSKWKGPFVKSESLYLVEKNYKRAINGSRNTEILPEFIGLEFKIYNGKNFYEITINEDMVGHKFGEFSLTRKEFSFKKKSKITLKKSKSVSKKKGSNSKKKIKIINK